MIEGITLVQALLAAEARHQADRLALEVAFEAERAAFDQERSNSSPV